MTTKLLLRRLFRSGVVASIVALLGVVFVIYPLYPQLLIDIRYGLFGRFVGSPALADLPPSQLRADGFLEDSPRDIAAWKSQIQAKLQYIKDLPSDFPSRSTLEKAKFLAAQMSGGGGAGPLSDSALLIDKLQQMPAGFGKCSDYVEGFQALCSIFDIDSYEFSITHHTVAAVHCPELGKWVFLDPQFCLLARDNAGQYLSPVEMRETAFSGRRLDFHFFGDRNRQFARLNPQELGYYDTAEDFVELIMPYGNNVFAVDAMRTSLRWIPKPIRQLWYKWTGALPEYLILRDAHTKLAHRVLPLRYVSLAVATILVLLCAPYIAFWCAEILLRLLGAPITSPRRNSDSNRLIVSHVAPTETLTKT